MADKNDVDLGRGIVPILLGFGVRILVNLLMAGVERLFKRKRRK